MPSPKDIYVHCDVLENIPKAHRDNWLREIELLRLILPANARVLQIGSMDGTRALHLLKVRQDLHITGLEIEASLVELAKQKISGANLRADFIHGDITQPPTLPRFDVVICLNNTLGYIPEQEKAIAGMKKLGKIVIMKDFTTVKRYLQKEVKSWGGAITEMPIGYFCVLGASN